MVVPPCDLRHGNVRGVLVLYSQGRQMIRFVVMPAPFDCCRSGPGIDSITCQGALT